MSEARNGWTALYEQQQVKQAGGRKVNLLGKDTLPLPSLRGPRSPKGVAGGMDAEADKARRLKRQREKRAAKQARIPTEHAEQTAVIQWWAIYAAAHKIDVRLLLAIPNAQKFMSLAKNMHAALATVRAEGFRDGAPDLLLAKSAMVPTSELLAYHGLFIEVKRLDGKLSADQHSFGLLLQSQGYAWVVAKGAGEAIKAIEAYLVPSKAAQDAEIPRLGLAGNAQAPKKAVG